jgi:hypothetical protein
MTIASLPCCVQRQRLPWDRRPEHDGTASGGPCRAALAAHTRSWAGPIAAPLEQCAELLGVDLATIREAAANVEPYLRADGTRIWSLMQLARQLRPEVCGRRPGGYLDRRRTPATDA